MRKAAASSIAVAILIASVSIALLVITGSVNLITGGETNLRLQGDAAFVDKISSEGNDLCSSDTVNEKPSGDDKYSQTFTGLESIETCSNGLCFNFEGGDQLKADLGSCESVSLDKNFEDIDKTLTFKLTGASSINIEVGEG